MTTRRSMAGFGIGLLACVAAGCAPMSMPPPVHFLETAKVLDRGATSVTAGLGAGHLGLEGEGSGAGARVRYGIAGWHEVGADVVWIRHRNEDTPDDRHPWLGTTDAVSGQVAWKTGLTSWVAIVAGLGGSHAATGNAAGGGLGLICSLPDRGQRFRPYAGLRLTYVRPVGRPVDDAGGPTRVSALGAGVAWRFTDRWRALVELASLSSSNQGWSATDADPYRGLYEWKRKGSYFAVGVERTFGGTPGPADATPAPVSGPAPAPDPESAPVSDAVPQ